MKRKYLDDIGIKDRPDLWGKKDSRREEWRQQRKIYSFDERETWSLGPSTFYCWLYERLKMFLDVNCIDLNYHKFEYKDKEYTQKELIGMMLERIEFCFSGKYNDYDDEQWEYVHEIEKIWATVLPAMWW